jgi:hypothetical protein
MTLSLTCPAARTRFRNALPIVLLSALLHACGGGGGEPAQSGVGGDAPGGSTAPPPGTSAPANRAPVISGNAPLTVQAGTPFSFRPSSSDADGDTLTFSITNKPAWATFNATTGSLTGTPSVAGTFSGIVIGVSDGKESASLAAFSVTVNEAPAGGTGSATVSWTPPTLRSDGSPLNNLAGYRIHYGTSSGSYSQSITVDTAGLTTFTVENLAAGTYYFAVTAFDSAGMESSYSTPVSKTIG